MNWKGRVLGISYLGAEQWCGGQGGRGHGPPSDNFLGALKSIDCAMFNLSSTFPRRAHARPNTMMLRGLCHGILHLPHKNLK